MGKVKTIVVTGKGGTGKTMLSTLMIRLLSKKNKVLAIDADSAVSLPYTLGLEVRETVSQMRKSIIGHKDVQRKLNDVPLSEAMRRILTPGEGYDLLTMGRPEEPGCFCAVNELLRCGIDMLINDYDVAIIDGEAGPEQINRRVIQSIDVLLVVSDMSARSLGTAKGIIDVTRSPDTGIRVKSAGLVLNRVRNDSPLREMLEKIDVDIVGTIPEDGALNEYDRTGKSLLEIPDSSPCILEVKSILNKIAPGML